MKTKFNFSLLLQKLCDQRSVVKSTSGSNGFKLVGLLTLFLVLSFQQAKADYFWQYTDYFKITGTTNNGWLDIQIIGIDTYGDNDRMEDCTLKYSDDNGLTYKNLMNFNVLSNALDGSCTDLTTGQNYVNGKIVKPSPLYYYEGDQAFCKVKWYYPASVVGKSLKFRIEGSWFRNYATSGSKAHDVFTGNYYYENVLKNVVPFTVPAYNPSTSFSLTPNTDGKYKFTWSGASAYVSNFEFYTDATCTNFVGSVTGTTDTGSGYVKLGDFNVKNTYYIKQLYTTPSSVAGFSFTYEKKFATAISHAGYKYPESVNITPKLNDQKVEIGITAGNTSSTQAMKYYIKRDGTLLTPNGIITTNYVDATVSPLTDYSYTVYSVPDAWTDKSIVIPELSKTLTTTTKPKDITFANFKLDPFKGSNPYIKVSWNNDEWYAVNSIKLYKKNTTTNEWVDLDIQNTATSYNDITDIVENKYYSYKLEVNQWGKISNKFDSAIVIDKVAFTKIAATKNTFGDRINLQWTIDKLNLCDRFEIYRSFAMSDGNGNESWSNEVLVNQFTAQTLVNNWDDRDAAPGVLYKYKIFAIKKTTALGDIKVDASDIGFRMPVGVVTGRITYGSGTAVQGTSLYVSSSGEGGDMLYKSLKFSGDAVQGGKVNLTKAKHGCIADKGFTFQAWLEPLNRQAISSTVFEVNGEYSIRMNSDNILVLMGNTLQQVLSYKLESTIAENSYFHLGVAYGSDKKLKIFINGVAKDSVVLTNTYTCSFSETTKCTLANNSTETIANRLPFNGNIDDVRLWNRGITNFEATDNYNRYLGGSEVGLIGYWPMDEGIGTYAFDCSKTDKVFNESHITDIKKASSESVVPKKEQLSIKGVTDASGNYIIRGIPFTGDGSTYSITPIMGTHKFEPKQQLRYISPSSLVHNGTDFVDKSAFPVTVTVRYENTEYPVEGVSFAIDDNPVSKENKLVVTNENGKAEIDIPIGEHYIKATLTGHGFKNNGRFPSIGKVIVDESIQPINFTDSTLVSVTGRVAGGLIENAKSVGFNKGKANIGAATIVIKPSLYSNWSLNNIGAANSKRILNSDDKGKINSVATVVKGESNIFIKTDSITGEYFVKLPPIKEWTVSNVTIYPKNQSQTLSENLYNKTIQINPLISGCDTMIQKNKVDSFKYNVKQNFIHRVEPTIKLSDPFAVSGAYGDSTYIIRDKDDPKRNETIKLYTIKNGVANYDSIKTPSGTILSPFRKPVFTMGEVYTLKIEAYEEYFDKNSVSDKVPLSGAAITVENEMGKLFRSESKTAAAEPVPVHEMTLNSKGYTFYRFLAGFPKFTSPTDGLIMTVNMEYNNAKYAWSENGKFRGIVLGYEPIGGSDFVTKGPGPLMPLVVLRDPPGTNSYAYLEKGTTISYSMSSKTNLNGGFSNKNSLKFGYNQSIGLGLGFMVITETDTENSISLGAEGEYSSFTGTSNSKSLTLTEKVQTSSSPDFVGSNADVYIGTSTNVFSTDCNWLEISKEGSSYLLNQNVKPTTNIEAATEFRFSQNEIMTAQIPAWQKKIIDLLSVVTPEEYNSPTTKNPTTNRYITLVKPTLKNFSIDKLAYKVVTPSNNQKIGNQIDSMVTHIKNWQGLILRNEESKYIAKNDAKAKTYEKTNISFDAGAVVERSYNYTTTTETSSGNSNNTQAVIGTNFGFEIAGNGVDVEIEAKFGGGKESESNSSTQSTTSFGFVLSDDDIDNRFSVNVYKNKFLSSELKGLEKDTTTAGFADASIGSYIFELAAGQTSCPYEGVDSTLFYKGKTTDGKYKSSPTDPLLILATGSQALDVPKMDVLPVKVKTDVPNGKEASFTLKLESGSTGYSPRQYVLSVDENTNKDGAIISVDGTPLTENRTYYITKGEPLMKTLTVRQSKLDVLNYENIKLKFSSACDDISDTKDITVKFVPSCSDLDLVIDSLTMNTTTGNSVLLKLRNFSQDYTNFMGMKIQYKLEGEKDWNQKILAKKGVNFGLIVPDSIIPELKSSMDYRLNFKGKDDGRYQVRAMTICSDPNSSTQINNITPEFILVKDMVQPTSMGTPSPSSGILTPEEEIAVTFNEPLQTNRMVDTDFEVEGVLNGATLQHSEGLAFDGSATSQAFTESSISLQKSSFAIEGWVQTGDGTGMGNVFSIGEGADKLTLKMNKTSIALDVNDVQVGVTESITPKSDWQYVSLNYDAYTQLIKVFVLNSDENQVKLVNTLKEAVNPSGRLQVGSGFNGKIHQIAIWNVNRIITDLSDMNYTKSGTENNIVGYWPMDEANGKMAADKVRSRNMIVNSAWFVEPNGKSGEFNGIDNTVVINTATIPLTVNDNFSVEFWFLGKTQTNSTIFSCGKGNGDIKSDEKMSIGLDNAGALSLFTKDISYVIPNVTVLDGNWHHFAMSVSRVANANIYIDGQQRLQVPSAKISGLASDKMTIGSRSYYESIIVDGITDLKFKQDQYFRGNIDEVRIWKTALTSENIRLDMRSKLNNTTTGLIAYYPFEKEVNANGKLVEPSLEDASGKTLIPGISNNLVFSDYTPGIKMCRQKVKVNFNYTASENKIIFNINEPLKKIENCILEFAIKKVLDMNGNALSSFIKWTAFVNNNRLNWETESVAITKQVLDPSSFNAVIINKSGKYENFVIDGLPSWLSVNKTSGRLNPLEKAELTFTVDNSINVGSYESRVTLTGNNGIQEKLPVTLKVTGPRPNWTVNPYDYESSMNVTGQIQLEGVYQEDTEDILAAFIGNRCIGLAQPTFNKTLNCYNVYMDIYGSTEDTGLPVTFSLWDAGTGRIYPGVDVVNGAIQFVSGSILGSVKVPKIFNATDKIEQQLNIKKGWNWISTNVVNTAPTLLEQMKTGLEADGLLIKSKSNGYIEYTGGSWDGVLDILYQKSMYLLKSAQPKTLKIVGATAKSVNYPVTISPNWNWIGYVPQFVAPVKEALSGLTVNEGDQIKGQIGFATYSDGIWNGSLEYMVPGLGYMYFSTNATAKTFNYPSQYISQSKVLKSPSDNANMQWSYVESDYQSSMTVTAIAKIDNLEIANKSLQVGVFIDDVCRGSMELKYSASKNRYFAYLSVWGNATDLFKKVTFKCFDPATGKELVATDKSLGFVPDNIVGSTASPYVIGFNTTVTNNQNLLPAENAIYPNPVMNTLYFNYNPSDIKQFEIVDCTGQVIKYNSTLNKNSVNVDGLIPGIYTIHITYKGENYIHRFIKK